jgi:hypothetical protein
MGSKNVVRVHLPDEVEAILNEAKMRLIHLAIRRSGLGYPVHAHINGIYIFAFDKVEVEISPIEPLRLVQGGSA